MYFNDNKQILEAEEFKSLHLLELSEEHGHQFVTLKFLLDGAQVQFAGGADVPTHVALTDSTRTMVFGVEPEPAEVVEAEVAEPAVEVAPEPAAEVAPEPVPAEKPAEPAVEVPAESAPVEPAPAEAPVPAEAVKAE